MTKASATAMIAAKIKSTIKSVLDVDFDLTIRADGAYVLGGAPQDVEQAYAFMRDFCGMKLLERDEDPEDPEYLVLGRGVSAN